ncbi:MAG TPA: GNAT family N-acetyltransferase [Roseateles sp.]|nr:GNAT family N-acetyltransferase [Roseateles sp.]
MSFRPAVEAGDSEALARLWAVTQLATCDGIEEIFSLDATRTYVESVLMPLHDVFVAARGEAPIGFIALCAGHIAQLHVDPHWQRRGVGAGLIAVAKAREPAGLSLSCVRERVGSFYEANGFQETRIHRVTPAGTYVEFEWRPRHAPIHDAAKGRQQWPTNEPGPIPTPCSRREPPA